VISYLHTGLVGCSVDPEINRDARKLTRTSQVKKKKLTKKENKWKMGRQIEHLQHAVSKARNRNHPTSFLNTEVRLGKFFKTIST
jgi:hypothetical protein